MPVKNLTSLNDSELYYSYAQIIFLADKVGQGVINKDATIATWSPKYFWKSPDKLKNLTISGL